MDVNKIKGVGSIDRIPKTRKEGRNDKRRTDSFDALYEMFISEQGKNQEKNQQQEKKKDEKKDRKQTDFNQVKQAMEGNNISHIYRLIRMLEESKSTETETIAKLKEIAKQKQSEQNSDMVKGIDAYQDNMDRNDESQEER